MSLSVAGKKPEGIVATWYLLQPGIPTATLVICVYSELLDIYHVLSSHIIACGAICMTHIEQKITS